ncbi:MAG: NADPH-dependent F420 reductase [Microthrixaceae bacterium]
MGRSKVGSTKWGAMNIAIIGAGNVGGGLGRALSAAGNQITFAAADPGSAGTTASEIGATVASSNAEAVRGAEVVILAVPYSALHDVIVELAADLSGKVVIDSTNPLGETGFATDRSAAEEVQDAAPEAKVVKAFNTIFAGRHGNPTEGGEPLDAFYAGDDAEAKATVAELAGSIGYRPIDCGPLEMARSLERMAFLNISLNSNNGWSWQSGWRLVGPLS